MSDWSDLTAALKGSLDKLSELLQSDDQLKAFTTSNAIEKDVTFGIKSSGSDNTLLITVSNGSAKANTGASKDALFTLVALPEQWEQHFKAVPAMPYQSYWGMFGMNIKQKGIEVLGDQTAFAQWTHVWRRVLELTHDAHCGPMKEDEQVEPERDFLTGKYTYLEAPVWGRCKVFYEYSGEGKQPIVFLHTAGSDSRQYHGVMNDARMRKKCIMYAFDLPGHGRSFPSKNYAPGAHTNTEDSYVGMITAFVKALGLRRPIICGASMAGQVCLAVAIRHREVGAAGVIPLQGSDYLNMERQWHDRSPVVNQSLFNPEWIYGMMAPTTPRANKQLIWHTYSAQAYGIFHGDLDFYFGGWDGRSRVAKVDTQSCPVYMLTGEYDWSNTPEMAQKTADKIPGAMHKSMPDLGHFPATENPAKFVPHLIEAIDHIQKEPERYPGHCFLCNGIPGLTNLLRDDDPGVIARENLRDGSYADPDPNQVVEWGRINARERTNESERKAHFKRETAREQPLFNNGVPPPITSFGQADKEGRSRPAPANARFDAVKFGSHERANRLERENRITQRESAQPRGSSIEARRLFNNEPKTKSPPPIHPPFPPPAATFIPGKGHNQTVEELRQSVGFQTSKDIYAPKGKKWSFSGTQSSNIVNGPLRLEAAPYNNRVTPFRGQAFLPNRSPFFSSDNHTQPSTSGNTPLRPEAAAFKMPRLFPREPSSLVDYATWPYHTDWAAVHKSFRADDIVVPASQLHRNPYSGALFNNSGQEVVPPPNKHPLPNNHPLNTLMTNNPETFHRGQLVKSRQVFPPPYNLPRGEVPSAIPEGEKGIELLQQAYAGLAVTQRDLQLRHAQGLPPIQIGPYPPADPPPYAADLSNMSPASSQSMVPMTAVVEEQARRHYSSNPNQGNEKEENSISRTGIREGNVGGDASDMFTSRTDVIGRNLRRRQPRAACSEANHDGGKEEDPHCGRGAGQRRNRKYAWMAGDVGSHGPNSAEH
ncbi:unnamed protein product [Alternaria alternata]